MSWKHQETCKLGFNNLYWDFLLSWKCKTARLFSFKQSFALLAATKQNAYLCKLIKLIQLNKSICDYIIMLDHYIASNSVDQLFLTLAVQLSALFKHPDLTAV